MVRRRSLHRVAEELYYALEEDGFFDDAPSRRPARRRGRSRTQKGMLRQTSRRELEPKKKRKVSAYQKEFGRQLKKLKSAHPRTPVTRLMKRAHAATRKARRGK